MKIVCVNHHLFQEGDTYGLIYAILLNMALGVGDFELHALFYINGDQYDTDSKYRAQVERRFGYFRSFGLLERRVKLVFCRFHEDPNVVSLKVLHIGPAVIEVIGNPNVLNRNPRNVSLALTEAENDPGKKLLTMRRWIYEEDAEKYQRVVRAMFALELGFFGKQLPQEDVAFRYISYSTDYILRCVREVGYECVTDTLTDAVLNSTSQYTEANQRFLQDFMSALLQTKLGLYEAPKEMPLIILFWIRGTKEDEQAALDGDRKKSIGKPQHHTNVTLYKHVRELTRALGEVLQQPVLFVPIGDRLTERLTTELTYAKTAKDHNLIEFFRRKNFANKPMGAQMNFLTLMALRYPVVQIGMRSGSMERLMYLGVPTVYFDRTQTIQGLQPLVGAARIRQLCGLQGTSRNDLHDYLLTFLEHLGNQTPWTRGFPFFFHIENRDTGFMRYSLGGTTVDQTVTSLIQTLPQPLPHERLLHNVLRYFSTLQRRGLRELHVDLRKRLLTLAGLQDGEAERLTIMLWFINQTYRNYASRRRLYPDRVVRLRRDDIGRGLLNRRDEVQRGIDSKRQDRANRSTVEVDLTDFDLFGSSDL